MTRTPLRIPQAGTAITEGTLVEWLLPDGAPVVAGAPLYRLETEKVEMEVDAPVDGVLRCSGRPGTTYPVGSEVGHIEGP